MGKVNLKKLLYISLLVAGSVLLNSMDYLITSPFPFVKIGFSHIVSLVVLYLFGRKELIFVLLFKVFLVGLIWGKLFTPVFFISLTGNLAAGMFLIVAYRYFSLIFLSIGGSFFNNFGQSLLVYFLLIPQKKILTIFGIMFLIGIVSGFFVALAAKLLLNKLEKYKYFDFRMDDYDI